MRFGSTSFIFALLGPACVHCQLENDPASRFLTARTAVVGEAERVAKSVSGVPYRRSSQGPNDVRRIEFITLTVDDLHRVAQWYVEVLGAREVDFCEGNTAHCHDGIVRYAGDDHQAALFGSDVDQKARPDISAAGSSEAQSRFFILGNGVVQLLKIAGKVTDHAFDLHEPRTSPVWVGQAHMCFWVDSGLDANEYIASVERNSHDRDMTQVKFNRPVPQETREDRNRVPESEFANKAVGGSFDGLAWAYFKGPIGEQYEIYQMERTIKRGIGRAFCDRGAVSSAFVEPKEVTPFRPLSQQLTGIFQYGYRTADVHKAVGFYDEVLGGDLVTYPTEGSEIMQDDSSHWMILANETIEAYEYAASHGVSREDAMRRFAVPNISASGANRLDHRFVLFDNFVVEALQYTDGLSFGADGYNPKLDRGSSPAYVGTVCGNFGIDAGTEWGSYLSAFDERLAQQGYHTLKAPQNIAGFAADHPYSGLEYGYFKGPDGEAISLVRITGRFQEVLHEALRAAGGVSTMFEDTNPHAKGEMNDFCAYAEYNPRYEAMEIV